MRVCRTYVRDTDRHRENPSHVLGFRAAEQQNTDYESRSKCCDFCNSWEEIYYKDDDTWEYVSKPEWSSESQVSVSSASFSESNWTFFVLSPSSMLLHLPPTLHFHHQTAQTQLHTCLLIDAHLFLIKTWHIAYRAPCDDWLLVFKHPEICCGLPYWHQVYCKNCQERNQFKGCQSLWSHLWWERREVIGGWRNCLKNYINNELLPITLTSYKGESTCCFDLRTLCYLFLQIHSIPMHTCFPFGHRHSIPSSAVNEWKRSSAFAMDFSPQINCI